MYHVASHPGSKRSSDKVSKMEDFYGQNRVEKEVLMDWTIWGKLPLGEGQGSIMWITSVRLTR